MIFIVRIFVQIGGLRSCARIWVASGNRGPRDSALPNAASTHKNLRLQELIAFARLALHVVDGVVVTNIGVKTENHRSIFRALVGAISRFTGCALSTFKSAD